MTNKKICAPDPLGILERYKDIPKVYAEDKFNHSVVYDKFYVFLESNGDWKLCVGMPVYNMVTHKWIFEIFHNPDVITMKIFPNAPIYGNNHFPGSIICNKVYKLADIFKNDIEDYCPICDGNGGFGGKCGGCGKYGYGFRFDDIDIDILTEDDIEKISLLKMHEIVTKYHGLQLRKKFRTYLDFYKHLNLNTLCTTKKKLCKKVCAEITGVDEKVIYCKTCGNVEISI